MKSFCLNGDHIMKFLADRMLGKLAKWLRFLGYDTLYPEALNDNDLIGICKAEQRTLLTRDKELVKSKQKLKGVPAIYYLKSHDIDLQLKQLIQDLNLEFGDEVLTRCAECNALLTEIAKNLVKGQVPNGVYERQNKFWHCSGCDKYYWQGSHFDQIQEKLELLQKDR